MGGTLLIGGIVGIVLGVVMLYASGGSSSPSASERVAKMAVRICFGGFASLVAGTTILISGLA